MYCTNCGSDVSPDDAFCTSCGAEVKPEEHGAPAAAAPPVPPAQPAPPPAQPAAAVPPIPPAVPPIPPAVPPVPSVEQQPPGPPEGTPAAAPPKQKGSKKWLAPVLIGVAVILVAAVVVVLVLVVFAGGGPQATVNDLYKAMEKGDTAAVVALVDTSELSKQAGLDTKFKEYIQKNMPSSGMKFSDLKFETTVNGNNATVKTVSGKVSGKDESGKAVTEDITKTSGSNTTYLVKKDGKWYLDTKTFPEFYAAEYLKEADAALGKLGTDTTAELDNIKNAISSGAQGVTSMQELDARFKAQVPAAEKTLADLKKQAEETKAKYKSVESLKGVEEYKNYAGLRGQSVDVIIEVLDKLNKYLDELGGYISGIAANPPTTQAQADAAVQGIDNIVNSYQAEFEALSKKGDDLESQANELKATLGL